MSLPYNLVLFYCSTNCHTFYMFENNFWRKKLLVSKSCTKLLAIIHTDAHYLEGIILMISSTLPWTHIIMFLNYVMNAAQNLIWCCKHALYKGSAIVSSYCAILCYIIIIQVECTMRQQAAIVKYLQLANHVIFLYLHKVHWPPLTIPAYLTVFCGQQSAAMILHEFAPKNKLGSACL